MLRGRASTYNEQDPGLYLWHNREKQRAERQRRKDSGGRGVRKRKRKTDNIGQAATGVHAYNLSIRGGGKRMMSSKPTWAQGKKNPKEDWEVKVLDFKEAMGDTVSNNNSKTQKRGDHTRQVY